MPEQTGSISGADSSSGAAPPAKKRRAGLYALSAVHILAALLFYFKPDGCVALLNVGAQFLTGFLPLSPSSEQFWSAFAANNMALVGILLLYAAMRTNNRLLLLLLVLIKAIAAASFVFLFLHQARYFAYVAAAGFETLFAALILVFSMRRTS